MQYVMFGNTGMKVSRFCLGTMNFTNNLDLKESARIVDEAIDKGINFIDTADSYDKSEEVLGKILSSEKREKIYLTTKVYCRFYRDENVARNSRINIINSLERSLKLLKTDYVDLYQLHHPDADAPVDDTISTLDNLVKQGKIRYYGVSNHLSWQISYMLGESKAHNWEPPVSHQVPYSVVDRQIENEIVHLCRKFNIAIMCYGPLCGGLLTGKYMNEIPEGSRMGSRQYYKDFYLDDPLVTSIVEQLSTIAKENDLQMNQLAILWLLSKPHATTIILGGKKPEHYSPIYEIADQELPEDVVKQIDELSAPRIYTRALTLIYRNGPGLSRQ